VRHIGVDLSKRSFTACLLDADQGQQLTTYPFTAEGFAAFRAEVAPDDRVAVEVGPNSYCFHDQIIGSVAAVVLVSPYQFAIIARSKKKTDRQDAQALACFLQLDCLPVVVMPEPRIRALRQLFTTRETLVRMGTQLKNTGHAALTRNGIDGKRSDFATATGRARLSRLAGLPATDRLMLDIVLRQLEALEGELAELERAIIRLGKTLPGLKRLLQVRGLGIVAAIGVLAEIGDIQRFPTAKHLVSYAGLATAVRQSGTVDHRGGAGRALAGPLGDRERPPLGARRGLRGGPRHHPHRLRSPSARRFPQSGHLAHPPLPRPSHHRQPRVLCHPPPPALPPARHPLTGLGISPVPRRGNSLTGNDPQPAP
jgi:transposase